MRMVSSRGSIQSSIHFMAVSLIPRPPDLVAQACGQKQMHAVAHSICSWLLVFILVAERDSEGNLCVVSPSKWVS